MRPPHLSPMPRGSRIPTSAIRRCLAGLVSQRRPGVGILGIQRSPAPYRSSWWLEDLDLSLADGTECQLVLKDLTTPVMGSDAEKVKPKAVMNLQREPWVYRTILGPGLPGPPALWGVGSGDRGRDGWLFLERVKGIPLSEVGDFQVWLAAATWLGGFHTRVRRESCDVGHLLRHDENLHRWWFERAVSMDETGTLERLACTHRRTVQEVLASESTVLHGEFYPSNILVDVGNEGIAVRPIDWEMAGLGPASWDLAALTSGEWSARDRMEMLLAYRESVLAAGGPELSRQRLAREVTGCRLLLAVQWLGWSADWIPPDEHRQNWLEEAHRCADAL